MKLKENIENATGSITADTRYISKSMVKGPYAYMHNNNMSSLSCAHLFVLGLVRYKIQKVFCSGTALNGSTCVSPSNQIYPFTLVHLCAKNLICPEMIMYIIPHSFFNFSANIAE